MVMGKIEAWDQKTKLEGNNEKWNLTKLKTENATCISASY